MNTYINTYIHTYVYTNVDTNGEELAETGQTSSYDVHISSSSYDIHILSGACRDGTDLPIADECVQAPRTGVNLSHPHSRRCISVSVSVYMC